jgi:hypothetical protein
MKLVPVSDELVVPFKNEKRAFIYEAKDVFDSIDSGFRHKKMISDTGSPNTIIDEIVCRIYKIVPDKSKDISLYEVWGLVHQETEYVFSQRDMVQFCRYYKGLLLTKKTTLFNFSELIDGGQQGFTAIVNYRDFGSKEILHRKRRLEIHFDSLGDLRIMKNRENLQIVLILRANVVRKEE